ncbi:hypothetical protein [Hymenobacter ruricola]|uniref:CBM-cenC domain-containing protein n=1 Tax=Hymenobacter ruricola TaxID=2791023 RepID=A0ABS0I9U4_9BACT|nr:hypothetical protein [Hymenobacter ruricola]MBF9223736.1 hypothetical protein [Hymenobacter ruricola]
MKTSFWRVGAATAGLALLAACSSHDDAGDWIGDVVTANDYEAVMGWVPGATSITRDHAHSGRYADRVDAAHEWGVTFQAPLGQASVHALRGLDIEAWAYAKEVQPAATASLQVEVWAHGPGQDPAPLFSGSMPLAAQLQDSCVWTKVNSRFTLPPSMPYDANLRIFLWRSTAKKAAYLDDIRVKALE